MVADTILYNLGVPLQHWLKVEDWRTPGKNYAGLLPNRELIRWMLEDAFSDQ